MAIMLSLLGAFRQRCINRFDRQAARCAGPSRHLNDDAARDEFIMVQIIRTPARTPNSATVRSVPDHSPKGL